MIAAMIVAASTVAIIAIAAVVTVALGLREERR